MTPTTIAAISDLHVHGDSESLGTVFTDISSKADLLLLAGDLTDHGLPDEAHKLGEDLSHCTIPIAVVLGNHDYENGKEQEIRRILESHHVSVLQGDNVEINGIGIAGVKGFCGGFDTFQLASWGEKVIKLFVEEAVQEALSLEKALQQLQTPTKVVLTHYAPIQETIQGEPPELFAYLGCSRLEDVINRHKATIALHGHAHHGTYTGQTGTHIPVYNVALPVEKPSNEQYAIIEV